MDAGRRPAPIMQRVVQGEAFSGPIPPPDLLNKYNEAIPDGADRIMKMAEEEQRQMHRLQKWSAALVAAGQIGGFLLCMALIGGALWLALKDKPIQAFVGLAAGLGLLYWGYTSKSEKAPASKPEEKKP